MQNRKTWLILLLVALMALWGCSTTTTTTPDPVDQPTAFEVMAAAGAAYINDSTDCPGVISAEDLHDNLDDYTVIDIRAEADLPGRPHPRRLQQLAGHPARRPGQDHPQRQALRGGLLHRPERRPRQGRHGADGLRGRQDAGLRHVLLEHLHARQLGQQHRQPPDEPRDDQQQRRPHRARLPRADRGRRHRGRRPRRRHARRRLQGQELHGDPGQPGRLLHHQLLRRGGLRGPGHRRRPGPHPRRLPVHPLRQPGPGTRCWPTCPPTRPSWSTAGPARPPARSRPT